jgi:hypothetical protein
MLPIILFVLDALLQESSFAIPTGPPASSDMQLVKPESQSDQMDLDLDPSSLTQKPLDQDGRTTGRSKARLGRPHRHRQDRHTDKQDIYKQNIAQLRAYVLMQHHRDMQRQDH